MTASPRTAEAYTIRITSTNFSGIFLVNTFNR
jgi:hypothetical protein